MKSILLLLAIFGSSLQQIGAQLSVTVNVPNSWGSGSQIELDFRNTGSTAICSARFSLTLPSGTTIASSWNMDSAGNNEYTLPNWVNIGPGQTYTSTGMTLNGNGRPTVRIITTGACNGGGATTTTTRRSATSTATTRPTSTTTRAGTTTTTTRASTTTTSSSGATRVVTTDPTNAAINRCLWNNATGPIISRLNQPINGGIFTFYGAGGTGACGLNSGMPSMSAAASNAMFNANQQWVAPCTGTQWILNDAVCMNKCVRITYTCVGCSSSRTLTIPITNKCPECPDYHVDLSQEAFLYLEPQGGTVGIARGATVTYINCP